MNRTVIEDLAASINSALFTPALSTPIKTLDLPIAGKRFASQSLPLIYDFVNVVNLHIDKDGQKEEEDSDGNTTVLHLKECKKIVDRIIGTSPSSLGLHPAIYFYSYGNGRFQPTAFLAIVDLIRVFEKAGTVKFRDFIRIRSKFESLLLAVGDLANQVTVKHGSGLKGYLALRELYERIIAELLKGTEPAKAITEINSEPSYKYLKIDAELNTETTARANFSQAVKSAAFLKEALPPPQRCRICDGYIHRESITFDHIVRKQDGGLGTLDNAQLAHPFCNSTVKN